MCGYLLVQYSGMYFNLYCATTHITTPISCHVDVSTSYAIPAHTIPAHTYTLTADCLLITRGQDESKWRVQR